MKPVGATTTGNTRLQDLMAQLPRPPLVRVYVTDHDVLIAWVDPREVQAQLNEHRLSPDARVASVARPISYALTPDMPLSAALEGFLREQATVLPVTSDLWRNTLLGEVSRHDLLLAIQDRMTYPK